MVRLVPQVPVPQILEDIVELWSFFPQERLQQGIHEKLVDLTVPQLWEEIGEVVSLFLQEVCSNGSTSK